MAKTTTERVTLTEIRERTYKDRDAWWTVLLVDPVAARLVRLVAPWRAVTPNRLTVLAFLFGLGAAACFWQQTWGWLATGAALFHLSFVLDCMDGKIARLNGTGSVFGSWLDFIFDRLRVPICIAALMGGQYARTGDLLYIWLAALVVFLDLFRYVNASQMNKVKNDMRLRLAAARGDTVPPLFLEEAEARPDAGAEVVDLNRDFRGRFGRFTRMRNRLVGHRIRAHLFSGIEFEMFVFIVAPASYAVVEVTLASAGLLVAFELLLIYKMWASTKSFERQLVAEQLIVQAVPAEPLTAAGSAAPLR